MAIRKEFDEPYYNRFYGRADERRAYFRDERRLGDFVCAYLKYMEQPVRRVLDIGCGLGQWRDIVADHFPAASYTGVEPSAYLCERHGWTPGSVVDFESRTPFDFVICKDILQYVSTADFGPAVANLARLCRGALYTSILTKRDWDGICDRSRTDPDVYLRSAEWYRRQLGARFVNLGGGLFLSERSQALPWELETLTRSSG